MIDVAPTALEAAGIPEPKMVNGVEQRPMDGVSMLYTTDDAKAADRRKTQYFEMFGNRAIYHEGWVAATRHSIPWVLTENPPLADDVWELYNVDADFSQADDLAAKNPEKLKELQALFMQEAERNHVLPIDDRRSERFNAAIAGRPDLLGGRKTMTVYDGMTGIMENAFINVKGVPHTVTAEIVVPDAKTEGVIIAQAGQFGGWSLYMKNGRIVHAYNFFGLGHTKVASKAPLAAGAHTDRVPVRAGRGEAGHRRQVDPEGRRRSRRRRPYPEDPAVRVLGRRGRGRRRRQRDDGLRRLQAGRHRLQGRDRQGDRRAAVVR